MKTVYTQGSFDILHAGHIRLLERSRSLGDQLIVSLLSDEAYEAYRGYPPAVPFEHRFAVLAALRCVDKVIQGDNNHTADEISVFKADIVTVGSDWAKKDIYKQWGVSQDWLDEHNILLVFFPYTEGISSTDIKQRLCKS